MTLFSNALLQKHSMSLRIVFIYFIRFCIMDLKTSVWCLLCTAFLYNFKHTSPWSDSSSFLQQLCAVYSPHGLWKLKYQSILIPTLWKCKNQAVCLLFREAAEKLNLPSHRKITYFTDRERRLSVSIRLQLKPRWIQRSFMRTSYSAGWNWQIHGERHPPPPSACGEFHPHNTGPEAITSSTRLYVCTPPASRWITALSSGRFIQNHRTGPQITRPGSFLKQIRKSSDWSERESPTSSPETSWHREARLSEVWWRRYWCPQWLHWEWAPAVWAVSLC